MMQALATLAGHDLDFLFVQNDAVKQRISGAESPIGLTVFCQYLIEEPGLFGSILRCMWPRGSGGGPSSPPVSVFGRALLTCGLRLAYDCCCFRR
jgi:hypothetical protein